MILKLIHTVVELIQLTFSFLFGSILFFYSFVRTGLPSLEMVQTKISL